MYLPLETKRKLPLYTTYTNYWHTLGFRRVRVSRGLLRIHSLVYANSELPDPTFLCLTLWGENMIPNLSI